MADPSGTTITNLPVNDTNAQTSNPLSTTTISTHSHPHPRIHLRGPTRYQKQGGKEQQEEQWSSPPLKWLERRWWVTHSTLPMWRKAKNVRITYKIISSPDHQKSGKEEGGIKLDDTVESEPTEKTLMPQPKAIRGVDTPVPGVQAAWKWRGRGWLVVASSYWEVLGWGEREVDSGDRDGNGGEKEKWVVTWFAPSMFTPAGVDIYSDRKEGGSEGLVKEILGALEGLGVEEVSGICRDEMRVVGRD